MPEAEDDEDEDDEDDVPLSLISHPAPLVPATGIELQTGVRNRVLTSACSREMQYFFKVLVKLTEDDLVLRDAFPEENHVDRGHWLQYLIKMAAKMVRNAELINEIQTNEEYARMLEDVVRSLFV